MIYKKHCNYCGKYYEGQGKYYCSYFCSGMTRRHKVKTKCKYCGNIIIDYKFKRRKYCNHSCEAYDINKKDNFGFKKGHIPWDKDLSTKTDERLKKLGEKGAKTRRKLFQEGKLVSGMKGKHHTEKSKKKNKESHLGKIPSNLKEFIKGTQILAKMRKGKTLQELYGESKAKEILKKTSGKNNYNWKDGATPKNKQIWRSEKMRKWRKKVFEKNNYICQKCKEKGQKLQPHHILNFSQYPELRFNVDNGITFCKKCHQLFHQIFGKQNNRKEQLEEFLKL